MRNKSHHTSKNENHLKLEHFFSDFKLFFFKLKTGRKKKKKKLVVISF